MGSIEIEEAIAELHALLNDIDVVEDDIEFAKLMGKRDDLIIHIAHLLASE